MTWGMHDMRIAGSGLSNGADANSTNGVFRGTDLDTAEGKVFSFYVTQVGVTASYSAIQVVNPVGSGVIILVDGFTASGGSLDTVSARIDTTVFATFVTAGHSWKSGNPDGQGTGRKQAVGAITGELLKATYRTSSAAILRDLRRPVYIAEGYAFSVYNESVNKALRCGIEWREI